MTAEPRIFGALLIVLFLSALIRMVRRQGLRPKYSFLWLGIGAVALLLVAVPALLSAFSSWAGIYYPPTLLFVVAIMLLMFVALHFSWELSRLEERTRRLAERLALADGEISELRQRLPHEAERGLLGDRRRG